MPPGDRKKPFEKEEQFFESRVPQVLGFNHMADEQPF
jgi:hypothetical protein